ncbi:hypothetical protein EON83_14420 [bacterium]|nr:MAG: hypothetical protein EON83_14420 [bacterium]
MKRLTLLLALIISVHVAFAQTVNDEQNVDPQIVVDQASSDIFPSSWLTPEVDAKAGALDIEKQQRGREIASKMLAKYPVAVLKANLKCIYTIEWISYSGVKAGGTNSRDTVYAIIKDQVPDAKLEEIMHAEFSSILLRNFPTYFGTESWQHINSPDFHYRGNGVEAIKKQQASENLSEALLEEGFLNEYAKASTEEDFNSFVGRLFVGDSGLWEAVEKYPRIKAKADLVINFYGKLAPSLTEKFFNSLRQAATEAESATKTTITKG